MIDRIPPQNIEAEKGVLGSVLLDHDTVHEVLPLLAAGDFYRDAHATIYESMRDVFDAGERIDCLTIAERLAKADKLKAIGGEDYLAEIVTSVPHAANARYYAQIVRQKSLARAVLQAATDTIRDVYSNEFTAEELIDRATRLMLDVTDRAGNARDDIKTLRQAMDRAIAVMESRRAGATVGVASGLPDLDTAVVFAPGTFSVIGARPGLGKSALALNIAAHAATVQRVPVLIFSMEMADAEIGERALSLLGEASGYQMRHPATLDEDGFARLMRHVGRGYDAGCNAPIFIDDTSGRTSMQVVSIARRARLKHDIGLVIVDYLQLCEADDQGDTRQEQVSKISRRLKVLARTLEIPVIALSQLNRQCEGREDRRPRKSDLRESGSLEQDADAVLLLYAPPEREDEAEIIVDKSRNGPPCVVRTVFRANVMKFVPWVPPTVNEGTF
jgi:replicative DNA helicase